jgi:hypothetical protein
MAGAALCAGALGRDSFERDSTCAGRELFLPLSLSLAAAVIGAASIASPIIPVIKFLLIFIVRYL